MTDGAGIKTGWVAASGFVGAALFVAALLWLNSYFNVARHKMIHERVLSVENTKLRDLRAQEAEVLNSYGWVDAEQGIARIPVDRAMELLAQEAREGRPGPRRRMIGMRILVLTLLGLFALAASAAAIDPPASAPASDVVPAALEGIDLVDRSGDMVPLDVVLRDETGAEVRLGDFFGEGKPVLIQLVYYNCPMLCTLVLNGFVEAGKPLDWAPGRDYTVVTVSFDPQDTPQLARDKKSNYVATLGKPGTETGWHFLVGEGAEVRRLADALGFGYRYVEERKEFAHAAGMFVITPEGKIARTLYGIEYPSGDFKLSLLEASEGRLGSPLDKLVLYCFQYDPETHKYALAAINVMKLGGLLTIIILGGFLITHWTRERRRAAHAAT